MTTTLRNDAFEAWQSSLSALLRTDASLLKWTIGDTLNEGEERFGQQAFQAVGPEHKKAIDYAWVAKNIPKHLRTEDLSWSHFRAIAAQPEDTREEWIRTAIQEDLTVSKLRARMKGEPEEKPVKTCPHCGEVI